MDPVVTGSLISAGSNLLGGLLGGKSKRGPDPRYIAELNRDSQLKYDRSSIAAKVLGAREAGIHPLYALGVPTTSIAPAHVDGGGYEPNGLAAGLAQAGSDIGRAVSAGETDLERLQKRLLLAQVEGQEIENSYNASRVARDFATTQIPPAFPSFNSRDVPMSDRFAVTPSGHRYPIPSDEYAQILENDPMHIPIYWSSMAADSLRAAYRNRVPVSVRDFFSRGYRRFIERR